MNTPALRSPLIIASIPGRLRLRAPGLRQRLRCDAAAERLRAIDGVVSVEPNPAAGSVLLRYDVSRQDIQAMEAAAAAVVAAMLPEDGPERGAAERSGGGAAGAPGGGPRGKPGGEPNDGAADRAALRLNRYAKLAMLVSLPTSLALAAAGAKKLHIATGSVFTLMLLVHLTTHRRRLLQ